MSVHAKQLPVISKTQNLCKASPNTHVQIEDTHAKIVKQLLGPEQLIQRMHTGIMCPARGQVILCNFNAHPLPHYRLCVEEHVHLHMRQALLNDIALAALLTHQCLRSALYLSKMMTQYGRKAS